jgi:FHA domain-containing protein
VSGMEELLARLKALFGPSPPVSPPREMPVTATPPVIVPEVAETRAPEPVGAVAERPLAEEPPAIVQEAMAIGAEAPTPIEEAEADVEPTPADALTLRLETERGSRSMFQVTKSGATIGRGPESTIQLADLSVSRKHARITYRQGAYWLSDLGSMGGTWVDGTKLAAPRRVATGQTIDIGVCRLLVVAGTESEKTGAAKGPSNAA